jgi:hypothetical protein
MGSPGGHRRARQRRSSLPLPDAALVRRRRRALSFSEVGPRVAVARPSSGHHQITNRRACWAVALTLRQPYRCMVPGHGSSLKPHPTPPQTTRATHPASSFAWMVRASKDSSTVAGAHLRWLGSHARGGPQKQRRHHARTRRGFFGNPRLFCAPTLPRRRSPAGARRRASSPATRPGASPPTSPRCRSCCAERTIAGRPLTVVNQRWLPTAAQGGNDAGRKPHPASFLFSRPPFSRYFEDEPGVDGRPHRMFPILTALPALHQADLPDE